MGKINKFKIGSIVTTKDTHAVGARFKIIDIYNDKCSIKVIKKYKFPIQDELDGNKFAEIGVIFKEASLDEFITPLVNILKNL